MRFMHLADLHIGKRVNEFSMIEDQKYILKEIISVIETEMVDVILIAGDVYDKSQPSAEAVELFDEFLTLLAKTRKPVFLISGNHDSPERLNFGKRLLEKNNLYIGGVFSPDLDKITLEDEFGPISIHLLPFVKPAVVKNFLNQEIETYDDAVRVVLEQVNIEEKSRNILVAHQFVTGGETDPIKSESENSSVGGIDQVFASHFQSFDYVALGHLHAPQKISRQEVRYAGSPLKYSASEVNQKKGITIVELKEKGNVAIEFHPLFPLREMREIKGPLAELIVSGKKEGISQDYMHVVLTDEEELYDAVGQLRLVYPNLMSIRFQKKHDQKNKEQSLQAVNVEKGMKELFLDFYQMQNQEELSKEQITELDRIIEEVGGLTNETN